MADDPCTPASRLSTPLTPLFPSPLPLILPAGGISLLAGGAGIGKTALLAAFLRDLRDGRPIFGHQPTTGLQVGVVNTDRGWAEGAGEWFARAGFGDIPYYSLTDDPTFNPKRLRKKWERTDLLFECIDKLALPKRSAVAVDPVSLFLGGNLLDYDTCAVACCEIRRMLMQRELTMIATAHSKKISMNKQDRYLRIQDHILGSTALFGFTDTQMYLATPEELKKKYYAFLWQPHMAPAETFKLERDAQGLFMPFTGVDEDDTASTAERVFALLPSDGAEIAFGTLVDLAEALPLKRRQVKNILETLLLEKRIEHVRHGIYRRCPPRVLQLVERAES